MAMAWIIPIVGLATVIFAAFLAWDVLKRDAGTPAMQEIAGMIFEGAMAFLRRQYRTIAMLSVFVAVAIGLIVGYFDESVNHGVLTGVAFMIGAICSGVAGFIGMYVAVRSNGRCAAAATRSLRDAVAVSLRGGAVSGFLVVGLSLIGVASLFGFYSRILGNDMADTPFLIVGFGFGASFVALFAQLGGGIYTKAADVGADLVGKVEAGIPEDDPRNAAVIADLVGDNVGDCAGRGADLFESTAAENIGAMILGVVIFQLTGKPEWILFPLVIRAFGIIATGIGIMTVPFFTKEGQDPMTPLNYGYYVITAISICFMALVTKIMMGDHWHWFFFCGLTGIATSVLFVYITQYYTAGRWRPVKEIVEASRTGPATNIIIGTAVGFETTLVTALAIGTALVVSFVLGEHSNLPNGGVFGTAVATMGMLMSAAYILSMDTFGPITDNANGIIEMSGAPAEARDITDALDAVGNTTKALTKGYAMASAGLAAFLLFSAYLDKVKEHFAEGSELDLLREGPDGDPLPRRHLQRRILCLGAAGRDDCLPVRLAGNSCCGAGGIEDHRGSAAAVPGGPGHHGRDIPPRLRSGRRHHGAGGAAGNDGSGPARGGSAHRYRSGLPANLQGRDPQGAAADAVGRLRRAGVGGGAADGRHDRRRHPCHVLQQRRRRLGQRQEVHRGGLTEGARDRSGRQGG